MIEIRLATEADWEGIRPIFRTVISTGDTYVFDPEMPEEEAKAYWFRDDTRTYVAVENGEVLGSYILKANQPALGSHVANASFMVSRESRGKGIGRRMGSHCLEEARLAGFRAMQFNFVVSTNAGAIRLWKELGFEIVGTLPGAYRHMTLGYVDAHVMFREL